LSPVLKEETELLLDLKEIGIKQAEAKKLLVRYGKATVKNQLTWLPNRNVKNPAGALIRALEENWEKPPSRESYAKKRLKELKDARGRATGTDKQT